MYIKNIAKRYGDKLVFNDISYDFADGAITFITGKSGCGKTTLLKIFMGIITDYDGEIDPAFKGKISAVFQENRLCNRLNAVANIKLVCNDATKIDDIVSALEFIGIDKKSMLSPVSKLSGGMARRTAIVRAFMADSDIIILDEPFRGLDEETAKKVIEYVLQNRDGRTIIAVTHNLEEINLLGAVNADIFK